MEKHTNILPPYSLLRAISILAMHVSARSPPAVAIHGDFPSLESLQITSLWVSVKDMCVPNLRVLTLATHYAYDFTSCSTSWRHAHIWNILNLVCLTSMENPQVSGERSFGEI